MGDEKKKRCNINVITGARANRSVLHDTNTNEEFPVDII